MLQSLWRTAQRFLNKLETELLYDPAIPLLGKYPEATIIRKGAHTPVLTAAPSTTARTRDQHKRPLTE